MAYRVVDKCIGGKGTDRDNPTDDADYEVQTNVADFVHHVFMQGVPYTKEGSNCYGTIGEQQVLLLQCGMNGNLLYKQIEILL